VAASIKQLLKLFDCTMQCGSIRQMARLGGPSTAMYTKYESVPIQLLLQSWFPGLTISNAKIVIYFQLKHTEAMLSNSTRKMLCFEITKLLIAGEKIIVIYYTFRHTFVSSQPRRVRSERGCIIPCDVLRELRVLVLRLLFFDQCKSTN